ncbi:helix-turn-helix domain-containing protein [Loktanella salsilacus]|uniref:helix-turn-helix domain-containing protein n=1 Tax=Loktanella salsilacus TaxID=195913 RepID=UPI003001194E
MPKIFTTKDKTAALEMLLEGASVQAVATKFGVHVSTIYALRKDRGHGDGFTNSACRNVHVRLTNDEFAALDDFIAAAGFASRTAALRSLIRGATGFLELPREDYLNLKATRSEVSAQGRNLNQISLAMNRAAFKGQFSIRPEDKAFLSDLRQAHKTLDKTLSGALRDVRQLGRDALHTAETPKGV